MTPAGLKSLLAIDEAAVGQFPSGEVISIFEPVGESNVRSSFWLSEGRSLAGTEETGDIFKTEDGGSTWGIQDVRNFLRAPAGHLYITTSEPALVARSADAGESWEVLARAQSSRTVGLVELDSGTMLAGLRRSENDRTSIIRSEDAWASFDWIEVSADGPRQNVTCFGYWGGNDIWAGNRLRRIGQGVSFRRRRPHVAAAGGLLGGTRSDGFLSLRGYGFCDVVGDRDGLCPR